MSQAILGDIFEAGGELAAVQAGTALARRALWWVQFKYLAESGPLKFWVETLGYSWKLASRGPKVEMQANAARTIQFIVGYLPVGICWLVW